MEKCDICGKECKTGQGLAGHKRWVHGVAPASAQLRLEQPNPLITKSVLGQLLDERFAVIAEQVDGLSGELAEQVKMLSGEQQQGEQQGERIEQLEQQLSAACRKSIEDFSPRERAEFVIPWLTGLDEEEFFTLARGTGHDAVPDPAVVTVLSETFRRQEEEAKAAEKDPKTILGKTDKPGYKYIECLNLSVKKSATIQGKTTKPGYKYLDFMDLSVPE